MKNRRGIKIGMTWLCLMLSHPSLAVGRVKLQKVAESEYLWTGIAVSSDKRVFVNYPRWGAERPYSVAEVTGRRSVIAYPDRRLNGWREGDADVMEKFVCVQSVFCDGNDDLWILDTGNPYLRGVIPGAAKLVRVSTRTNQVSQRYPMPSEAIVPSSYLNDVRIDHHRRCAYITDSGSGAIVILDLVSGKARRILADHSSTRAEEIGFCVEGIVLAAKIHCDGIALDRPGDYLYYKPLTARTLYRIKTDLLQDTQLSPERISAGVERVADVGICDGMEFAGDGLLYITSLEDNSIKRLNRSNQLETVCRGQEIKWPDSLAIGPKGALYFTISQLHLGEKRTEPFAIFRLKIF